MRILAFLVCFFFLSQKVRSQGIIETAGGALLVKDVLDHAANKIAGLIGNARKQGDYLLEKNLERVNLIIENLRINLSEELDHQFKQLNTTVSQTIYDLNALTQNAIKVADKKFLKQKEFLVMDVSDILNRIPFIKKNFYISSIDGIGQTYLTKGEYALTLNGTVYKFENEDSVFVNGQLIPQNLIVKGHNQLTIQIPAKILNPKFTDYDLARVEFTVKTMKKSEIKWYNPYSWFGSHVSDISNYTGNLLLLPRYPVANYRLMLYTVDNHWSEQEFDSEIGHTLLNRSGTKNAWRYDNLETHVPLGCLIIKDKIRTWSNKTGWVMTSPDYKFDDVNNKVSTTCGHQFYDSETDFYIQCKYRKPITDTNRIFVQLEHLGEKMSKGLKYDNYMYPFPANARSYALEINMFNGQTITFLPTENMKYGIEVRTNIGLHDFNSLLVKISQE